jgi:hypothetical protein
MQYPILTQAITTEQELQDALKQYAETTTDFVHNVVELVCDDSMDYLAATNGRGTIYISRTFRTKKTKFNVLENILPATVHYLASEQVSFEEEYAIECLWHEILHNQAQGFDLLCLQTSTETEILIEALHQAYTRLTYPTFLDKLLGAKPQHQPQIIQEGYAYPLRTANVFALFDKLQMPTEEQKIVLERLVLKGKYQHIVSNFIQEMMQKGLAKLNILDLIAVLDTPPILFMHVLQSF